MQERLIVNYQYVVDSATISINISVAHKFKTGQMHNFNKIVHPTYRRVH